MQALLEKSHAFSFFQVLQLLQRYAGGAPIGYQGPAAEEMVRIRPAVSLSFPASDIQTIELLPGPAGTRRFRVTTSFLGLYSSDSPLPVFYTEDLLWKENDQGAVREFLDMFHHRAFSLLYRSWAKYRYHVQFRHRGADEFSGRIFALMGLGTPALVDSTGVPSVRLLRFAGLMTQHPHSATALEGILKGYFDLTHVIVGQCVERWVRIEASQQNRLGSQNCTLARDCVIGERVRDRSGKFRVSIGPVTYQDFGRLTPVGADYAALVNMTRLLVADRFDFDFEVKMPADETPALQLSSAGPKRLGWTSWLPGVSEDVSVVFRQPRMQSPQAEFAWPEQEAATTYTNSEQRGTYDRRRY